MVTITVGVHLPVLLSYLLSSYTVAFVISSSTHLLFEDAMHVGPNLIFFFVLLPFELYCMMVST